MAPIRKSKKSVPPPPPPPSTKPLSVLAQQPNPKPASDTLFSALAPPPKPEATSDSATPPNNAERILAALEAVAALTALEKEVFFELLERPPPPPPSMVATAATQTEPETPPPPTSPPVMRTYAQVTTDTMDLDLPPPSPSTQVRSAAPPRPSKLKAPNPKPTKPKSRINARAFVVHGISVASPLSSTVRKVEMAVKQVAIGARWLLSVDRRKGKTASSVVVYFSKNVNVPDVITCGDRKLRVEEYEWGRVNRVV